MSHLVLQHVRIVALRVLAVLLALELAYLALANLLLLTPLLKRAVSSSDDVKVDYGWAISYLPGRVRFSDLELRIEDYNVQAAIDIAHGQVDIDLLPLMQRKFHALWVDVEGVRFRMRHKLSQVGDQGPRLAGYPKIAEFADPPLFEGPEPGQISDSNDTLWELQLQNVTAQLLQVWILEYRFEGSGQATGGFLLRPGRYVEVPPSTLDLDGAIILAQKVVANSASVHLRANVPGFDPRQVQGVEPARYINAAVELALREMDLSFSDVYGTSGRKLTGLGNLDADLRLEAGHVMPGSALDFEARPWEVQQAHWRAHAAQPLRVQVRRPDGTTPVQIAIDANSVLVASKRAEDVQGPRVEALAAHLEFSHELERAQLLGMRLDSTRVDVPDLKWFEHVFLQGSGKALSGRATLNVRAEREADGSLAGAARAEVNDAAFATSTLRVDGNALFDTRFAGNNSAFDVDEARLTLSSTRLTLSGRKSKTTNASIIGRGVKLNFAEAMAFEGQLKLHADRVGALLPLLGDSLLVHDLPAALLGDSALDAQCVVDVNTEQKRFELVNARAGLASARGHAHTTAKGLRGAFLVVTPYVNLGIEVAPGDVSVKPFVDEHWLRARQAPKGKPSVAAW